MDDDRRKARKRLGIPEWIAGRGAAGWAKALVIVIPLAMFTLWLIFEG